MKKLSLSLSLLLSAAFTISAMEENQDIADIQKQAVACAPLFTDALELYKDYIEAKSSCDESSIEMRLTRDMMELEESQKRIRATLKERYKINEDVEQNDKSEYFDSCPYTNTQIPYLHKLLIKKYYNLQESENLLCGLKARLYEITKINLLLLFSEMHSLEKDHAIIKTQLKELKEAAGAALIMAKADSFA